MKTIPNNAPAEARSRPAKRSSLIDLLLLLLIVPGLMMVTYYSVHKAPVVLGVGLANCIFYFHVAVAWGALYGPGLLAIFGILYLIKRDPVWDRRGLAAAEVSLVFCLGVLISGPIWAKAAWNYYWDWNDFRLQTFFILTLLLAGYFLLRSLTDNPPRQARIGAVMGILAAANSLLVWLAIRLFRTETSPHPGSFLEGGKLSGEQLGVLFFSAGVFSLLFVFLFRLALASVRVRQKLREEQFSPEAGRPAEEFPG